MQFARAWHGGYAFEGGLRQTKLGGTQQCRPVLSYKNCLSFCYSDAVDVGGVAVVAAKGDGVVAFFERAANGERAVFGVAACVEVFVN